MRERLARDGLLPPEELIEEPVAREVSHPSEEPEDRAVSENPDALEVILRSGDQTIANNSTIALSTIENQARGPLGEGIDFYRLIDEWEFPQEEVEPPKPYASMWPGYPSPVWWEEQGREEDPAADWDSAINNDFRFQQEMETSEEDEMPAGTEV